MRVLARHTASSPAAVPRPRTPTLRLTPLRSSGFGVPLSPRRPRSAGWLAHTWTRQSLGIDRRELAAEPGRQGSRPTHSPRPGRRAVTSTTVWTCLTPDGPARRGSTSLHVACVAELSRVLDQGGACGAAGPASAPGLSLGRPARRTPGRASRDTQTKARGTGQGIATNPLPRFPVVQLAATMSMASPTGMTQDGRPTIMLRDKTSA